MSGSGVPIVSDLGSMAAGIIPGEIFGGGGPATSSQDPTRADPAKSYTPKPRNDALMRSAGAEGQARTALEEEKRKRYLNYSETLLGNVASKEYVGAANMTDMTGGS